MEKSRGIKLGLLAIILLMAVSICGACARSRVYPNTGIDHGGTGRNISMQQGTGLEPNSNTRVIEGYIVGLDGSQVTIEQIEFLTTSHNDRIKELGLDREQDFVNGYYIHHDGSRGRISYPLADNVQIRFADLASEGRQAMLNNDMGDSLATDGLYHPGHLLGGEAGGLLGGRDMLNKRYQDNLAVNDQIPYFFTIHNGYITSIEEARAYSNFAGNTVGRPNDTANNFDVFR